MIYILWFETAEKKALRLQVFKFKVVDVACDSEDDKTAFTKAEVKLCTQHLT